MAGSQYTAKFTADGSGYARNLNKMRDQTKKFGTSVQTIMKSAFTFAGVGGLTAMTRSLISFGSEMSDLALRTKTTVKEFMVFRDVARDAGVEQSVLERALRNVVQRTQAAADGNKTYAKSIHRLGLNLKEFGNLTTAEKFIEIGKASHNAKNEQEAFRDVAVILGERAGPMLTEVLKKLATEGFDNLAKSAVYFNDQTAQELDQAEDAIQKFKESSLINLHKFAKGAKGVFSGVRASLAQMAVEAEGDSYFGRMFDTFFGDKTPEQELRIKLAFEEGIYGQELEDMLRERTSKGMVEGIRTAIDITQGLIDKGTPAPEGEDVSKLREKIKGQRESNLIVGEEDGDKLLRIQDQIAAGLEEYSVMKKDPFTEELDLLTKEYELLQLQNKELALIDKNKKKTAAQAKKDIDTIAKQEAEINAERKSREESGMSEGEILERRKQELAQAEEAFAALGKDANKDGKVDADDEIFRNKAELDIERRKSEIEDLESGLKDDSQTSIISSSLASIGGGGGTIDFGNDPILNENKKQTSLLGQIVRLQGGTIDGAGGLDLPEI